MLLSSCMPTSVSQYISAAPRRAQPPANPRAPSLVQRRVQHSAKHRAQSLDQHRAQPNIKKEPMNHLHKESQRNTYQEPEPRVENEWDRSRRVIAEMLAYEKSIGMNIGLGRRSGTNFNDV